MWGVGGMGLYREWGYIGSWGVEGDGGMRVVGLYIGSW